MWRQVDVLAITVGLEVNHACQRIVDGNHMRYTLANWCTQLNVTNDPRTSHAERDVVELEFTRLFVLESHLMKPKLVGE